MEDTRNNPEAGNRVGTGGQPKEGRLIKRIGNIPRRTNWEHGKRPDVVDFITMLDYATTWWLLQLVPRFTEGLKSALSPHNPEPATTFFSNPEDGPVVVDTSSLAVMVIIKGSEVPGTIIHGGSDVNVIN